jgi:hypothetical protein
VTMVDTGEMEMTPIMKHFASAVRSFMYRLGVAIRDREHEIARRWIV